MPNSRPITETDQRETATPPDSRPSVRELAELTEDLALAVLKQTDLSAETIEQIGKHSVAKSRKVRLAIVQHARTPRHVSVPILRHLFTFELMVVSLTPAVPADLKRAAEERLINRLESIPSGARVTLARRASGRIAGELLLDPEPRVFKAALENARVTEAILIRALTRQPTPGLVEAVCHHPNWSARREVRIALLRSEQVPLARALQFVQSLSPEMVRSVLNASRLPAKVKACLMREIAAEQ